MPVEPRSVCSIRRLGQRAGTGRAARWPGAAALATMLALAAALNGCGGGTQPADAPGSGPQRGSAARLAAAPAADPLAVTLPQPADPLLADLVIPDDAPLRGMWSATQPWPLNGLHSILLPNGHVLTFGTPTGQPATQDGRYYDLWDPALGFGTVSHQTSFRPSQANSFCGTTAFLPDGTLMVSSGNTPLAGNRFTPATGAVASVPAMLADERWYGTMLALPDGRALMVGGSTPYGALQAFANPEAAINSGAVSMTPEIHDPQAGWSTLPGAASRAAFGPDHNRYWYPRAWVAPGGQVFGISSEKMWMLDPAGAGAIRIVGDFKAGADAQTRPNVGPTSTAVMFAPGRILQVGGNGYHDGHALPASALATVVDIRGGEPVLADTAPMNFARHWGSATVLPDGRVVVTGGTRYANNGGADAVYEAELWDPATGQWTVGPPAAQIRVYHSAAILLPNGTVLSTGGGAPGPVNNLNAEVYYPPYLFRQVDGRARLAPRPVIQAISALRFDHGAPLQIDMAGSAAVARLVLLGTGATTHSFNTSQRHVPLDFAQAGARLAATLPAADAAPPGYYLLVALDDAGVPSAGVIVAVGPGTAAPPVPDLPRNQLVQLASVSRPGSVLATEPGGLGVLAPLGEPATAAELLPAQFILRDGLADSRCVSFESIAVPGQWVRHYGFRLRLGASDGSALFKDDATFCPEPGLAGSGHTLRSRNYPDRVMHHRDGQWWIDVQAGDAGFQADASFRIEPVGLPAVAPVAAPLLPAGATASYQATAGAPALQYQWDFGDGSPATAFTAAAAATHTYLVPGTYLVTLTLRLADGRTRSETFVQTVYAPPVPGRPQASTALLLEPRGEAPARLWVVNGDNDSVSVFDTATQARLAEIAVGAAPRTLALAGDGSVWVANQRGASISVIDTAALAVARTIALPHASQPFGLLFAPDGTAWVSLPARGQVRRLDAAGRTLAAVDVGPHPRHLALTADGARLLVSRFISPPLPGESTATVVPVQGGVAHGGEVVLVDTAAAARLHTVVLQVSTRADNEVQARGLPNYLGAAVVSPDGRSAWVPSKQDNLQRGLLRDGLALDFQSTVRAVSSRIDLAAQAEDLPARIDHDNAGLAGAAVFDPTGSYLFVALETARQVAVVAAANQRELFRIEAGRAPQALAVSADGRRLYVHNFMDRSIDVTDLAPLMDHGRFQAPRLATLGSVAVEKLAPQVLAGKQLFHDARDPRLARDAYVSCASCHNDGGHDGRVWDFSSLGEGLRNTAALRGRAGMGHGFLHWSANFDEVQDFEGQIRRLAGGTGLMSDADYFSGTRSHPLGQAKAGLSADLDALAAYLASLDRFDPSPARRADGTLSRAAREGRWWFAVLGCGRCHAGPGFTASAGAERLKDIGTLKPTSGQRLGGPLPGIDIPTLRDVWNTAPYLHDGSAATLEDAVLAHRALRLRPHAGQAAVLAAYLREIGAEEAPAKPAAE